MTPAVLRRSGLDFYKDGVKVTPRAMIAKCEVCGMEHAPFGFKDEQGRRTFYCSEHNPDRNRE